MEYLVELLMPKLTREVNFGEVQQWFNRPGQLVRKGESIAEIQAGTQVTVCRASDHGMLVDILVEEGRAVSSGEVIARLHFNGEIGPGMFDPPAELEDPEHAIESMHLETEERIVPIDWEEVERERMDDDGWNPGTI
jgi:pyruvate/2-oxoglutarate dehydrogenase complex dihydrolipoamide acyltransferase (E2) component